MTYRPPPQPPHEFGSDITAKSMGSPPVVQYAIDASKDWQALNQSPEIVANAIVNFYSSSIDQFINKQRQSKRLGAVEQTRAQMTLPGLTVDHVTNQGLEIIKLTVYPEFVNPLQLGFTIDLNLDGYVAFVHSWQALTAPGVDNAPIDLVVNGYGVVTNYTPDDDLLAAYQVQSAPFPTPPLQATVMFIIAFGTTALRCQSLQDAAKLNTFTAAKGSGGALSQIVPARPKIKASGLAPAHDDLLGYFVFNWGDQFNPDAWAYNGSQGSGPDFTFNANFPAPNLIKIIQFKNAFKSPLVIAGKNTFRSQHSSTPAVGTGQNGVDFLCAEFYNRSALRVVTSSWNYPSQPKGVVVNDQPLYFASDGGNPFSDTGAATNFTLDFDLTPTKSPAGACTFGTYSSTAPVANTLTSAQQAVLAANAAAAVIYGAAYNAALATLNSTQQALVTANQNIIIPSRGSDVTLAYSYAADHNPITFSQLVTDLGRSGAEALVAYTEASLAFQAHPTSQSYLDAFNAAEINLGSEATLVVGDYLGILASQAAYAYSAAYAVAYNAAIAAGQTTAEAQAAGAAATANYLTSLNSTEDALISYANSQGETSLANAASSALTAYIAAENSFISVQNNFQPESIQSDNFQPIDAFNHRIITVTMVDGKATNYVFGPWSQG